MEPFNLTGFDKVVWKKNRYRIILRYSQWRAYGETVTECDKVVVERLSEDFSGRPCWKNLLIDAYSEDAWAEDYSPAIWDRAWREYQKARQVCR